MSKQKGNMTDNFLEGIISTQAPEQPAPEKMTKAAKTVSVYLSAEQHAKLDSIAKELHTNKHAVMQLAMKKFIRDYDNGYRPEPLYKLVYY